MGLESKTSASAALLVTLSWGEASVQNYCSCDEPLTVDVSDGRGAVTFSPVPKMDIDLPENHAGARDKAGTLTISSTVPPFDAISRGYSHAPVTVAVWSVEMNDNTSTRQFTGKIGKGLRNPNGLIGIFRADLISPKARLENLQLSMACTQECQNIFAGPVCGVDASAFNETGTITAVNRSEASLSTDLSGVSAEPYYRGKVVINDEYPVLIKAIAGSTIYLYEQPDPAWNGLPFTLQAGCRKQYSDCEFWNATSRFNGLGFAMPSRNPSFET